MEIILKEDIIGLGFKNDIVNVKPGYGRNYLIPFGKAVIASESAKKVLAEDLRQRAHKLEKIKNEAVALGEKLAAVSLTIPTKVSSTGAIYGSVNSLQEWIRCFEQARLAGVVQGGGANDPGEMALHTDKLQKAYEMGKNI